MLSVSQISFHEMQRLILTNAVTFSEVYMWSTLQGGMAITCACLPTLAPVLPIIVRPFTYIKSWSASIWSRSKVNSGHADRGLRIADEYELARENQPEYATHAMPGASKGTSRSWARGNNSRARLDPEVCAMQPITIKVNRNVEDFQDRFK